MFIVQIPSIALDATKHRSSGERDRGSSCCHGSERLTAETSIVEIYIMGHLKGFIEIYQREGSFILPQGGFKRNYI